MIGSVYGQERKRLSSANFVTMRGWLLVVTLLGLCSFVCAEGEDDELPDDYVDENIVHEDGEDVIKEQSNDGANGESRVSGESRKSADSGDNEDSRESADSVESGGSRDSTRIEREESGESADSGESDRSGESEMSGEAEENEESGENDSAGMHAEDSVESAVERRKRLRDAAQKWRKSKGMTEESLPTASRDTATEDTASSLPTPPAATETATQAADAGGSEANKKPPVKKVRSHSPPKNIPPLSHSTPASEPQAVQNPPASRASSSSSSSAMPKAPPVNKAKKAPASTTPKPATGAQQSSAIKPDANYMKADTVIEEDRAERQQVSKWNAGMFCSVA